MLLYSKLACFFSEVQAVTMTGTATGGTYALTLDGVATGEISHNADDIEIQEAIALLPIVGGDIDLITVTGDARAFTVSFDSTLGDLSAMTVDDSNLVGLTGKSGEFNLNTLEIIELLNGQQSNTGFFEIVLYDTDNSQGETVSLSSVAVVQDIIPDSPPSVTPVVEYADKIHTHPISDITGLQANLTRRPGQSPGDGQFRNGQTDRRAEYTGIELGRVYRLRIADGKDLIGKLRD